MSNQTPAAAPAAEEVSTLYAKRRKIFARSVRGLFDNWRIALVVLTQAIFYGGLWLEWNGRQALLFHLVERKFYLFGLVFWPQDVIYLAILLIVSAYALFLVTAIGGRLFCGYACPQTVYTEIFMWIENWVEGDRAARMKLDKAPWSPRKLRLRAAKHALWLALSLWTGFTLVGYFTPVKELVAALPTFSFGGWEIFWIFFYGGLTYLMAGFMREQVCKYMCPYARFQSVMFDPDTLIVTYDPERGEPRGPRTKSVDYKAKGLGDCIDCTLCVQVCPTGIDIRNGLQYECIGCGLCVDACDTVMDKMKYPRGLIRFSTQNGVKNHWTQSQMLKRVLRPRVLFYTSVLVVLCIGMLASLVVRTPLKVDVVRDRAALSRIVAGGKLENIYRLQIMNATEGAQRYVISARGLPGLEVASESEVDIGPADSRWVVVRLQIPYGSAPPGSHTVYFDIQAQGDKGQVAEKSVFLVPR